MINEEKTVNNEEEDADDQRSQQDVHSDGIDPAPPSEEDVLATEIDNLAQADKASEASFTLNIDKGIAPEKKDKE